jgi:inorganic pyrophosphatase
MGTVKTVKVLGTYAMIDEGETDWKLLCIDVNHPKANQLNGKGSKREREREREMERDGERDGERDREITREV